MIANQNTGPRPLSGRTVLVCFIAFFGVVSFANAIMIRAAVTTFSGLETGSAYQAGQNFEYEVEAARAQEARHWQVRADVRPAGGKTLIEYDVDASRIIAATTETSFEGRLSNTLPTREGEKPQPRESKLVETAKSSIKLIQ